MNVCVIILRCNTFAKYNRHVCTQYVVHNLLMCSHCEHVYIVCKHILQTNKHTTKSYIYIYISNNLDTYLYIISDAHGVLLMVLQSMIIIIVAWLLALHTSSMLAAAMKASHKYAILARLPFMAARTKSRGRDHIQSN